jgi:hypothetical protein
MKCKFCADGRFFMQVGEQLLLERWVSKIYITSKLEKGCLSLLGKKNFQTSLLERYYYHACARSE